METHKSNIENEASPLKRFLRFVGDRALGGAWAKLPPLDRQTPFYAAPEPQFEDTEYPYGLRLRKPNEHGWGREVYMDGDYEWRPVTPPESEK